MIRPGCPIDQMHFRIKAAQRRYDQARSAKKALKANPPKISSGGNSLIKWLRSAISLLLA